MWNCESASFAARRLSSHDYVRHAQTHLYRGPIHSTTAGEEEEEEGEVRLLVLTSWMIENMCMDIA